MATHQKLQDLVPEQFIPLYPLEEKLLEAAPLGQEASDFEPDEPIDMAQIGEAQTVRSELLVWLLTTPNVKDTIHHKGINLRGANLVGLLDLEDTRIEQPLRLLDCKVENEVILRRGVYKLLDFSGSQTIGINAWAILVIHDVLMKNGFKAKGEVNLVGAEIGGTLHCEGGEFKNPDGYALMGNRLTTKGSVFFCDGFKAKGIVQIMGAKIGGQLHCDRGEFENPGRLAIEGDSLITMSSVFLNSGFMAKGEVRLFGANIGGDFFCSGGEFENHNGCALRGQRLITKGSVFLNDGFIGKGEVNFVGAEIGNSLTCQGGKFENPKGTALNGTILSTRESVFLNKGFKAKGEVNFIGANIGRILDCRGGEFYNPSGVALICDGLTTQDAVVLGYGFKATGLVQLRSAKIGSNLDCTDGYFDNPGGVALLCDGLTTTRSVLLRNGFKASGLVRLHSAKIDSDLDCTDAVFDADSGLCFLGDSMEVEGTFHWHELRNKINGSFRISNAKVGNLLDDNGSWPNSGNLYIDGFTYGPFSSDVPDDSKSRLNWLSLRNPNDMSVQPFEQLISVFRLMGLRDDARDIAIAKQRFIHNQRKGLSRFWSWILDITISYGYRPEKVILFFIIPIILFGALVFSQAYFVGAMAPTASSEEILSNNLIFDEIAYSIDVFLPIVDLHQEDAWKPDMSAAYGIYFQYYMYIHILAGWLFTTLAVAAVTGLVRRD